VEEGREGGGGGRERGAVEAGRRVEREGGIAGGSGDRGGRRRGNGWA
jgi:hypothetical protein